MDNKLLLYTLILSFAGQPEKIPLEQVTASNQGSQ